MDLALRQLSEVCVNGRRASVGDLPGVSGPCTDPLQLTIEGTTPGSGELLVTP